jgi:hypothetical protein
MGDGVGITRSRQKPVVRVHLVVRRNLRHRLLTRIASKATRALNAAEWFRLGLLMDFPPVMPRQNIHLSPCPKNRSHLSVPPPRCV